MRVDGTKSSTTLVMSWDEAVRLGAAINAGCEELGDVVCMERIGVPHSAFQFLCYVLWDKDGCFAGVIDLDIPADDNSFIAHVERYADSVSVTMSHDNIQRLGQVMRAGLEGARSRADYYVRHGLSMPEVERVTAVLDGIQATEVALEWGNQSVELPLLVPPTRGWTGERAWIVVRIDEDSVTGGRTFIVERGWKQPAGAHEDAQSQNGHLKESGVITWSWYEARTVLWGLSSEVPPGDGSNLFLVGRVSGRAGDEELLPGSLWWSETDAAREAERCSEASISRPYQVWETWLADN